jgi:hypothetical protein
VIVSANSVYAQDSTKEQKEMQEEALIKSKTESRNYHFVANSMKPRSGSTRTIQGYGILVHGDTLQVYLPYTGRAFSPYYGSSDDGTFDLKLADFGYEATGTKKGGWEIAITPKNVRDISKLSLSVTKSGGVELYLSSNTKQSISYYGYIQ